MAEKNNGLFVWLQDNARILLSIALVLFLLFAVYSYSQRTERTTPVSDDVTSEEQETLVVENGDIVTEVDVENGDIVTEVSLGESADTIGADADTATEAPQTGAADTTTTTDTMEKGPSVTYRENDISVSAMRGEGLTHLARRAAAEYIAQNNIKDLSAAQKVYIEDYVRKSVASQSVFPGTTVVFTHQAISSGIEKAQALTDAQKHNLEKYTAYAAL